MRTHPSDNEDRANALVLDTMGNVHVTGRSFGAGSDYDYVTLKYDASGSLLWERRYDGFDSGYDSASALAVDASGNVFVAGQSGAAADADAVTLKYDALGNEMWVHRYSGTGNGHDSARALTLDPFGNLYMIGESAGLGTGADIVTIKYAARRFARPGKIGDPTTVR